MTNPTKYPDGKGRTAPHTSDAFDDEVTIPISTGVPSSRAATPRPIFADEDTRPVDVAAMDRAAKQSRFVDEPDVAERAGSPRTIVAAEAGHPIARMSIAGVRGAIELRIRNVSATGLVLELDAGQAPGLTEGIAVSVQLRWRNQASPALAQLRLAGTVAHRRDATASAPGGMSVRWNQDAPGAATQISAVISAVNAQRS